MEEGGKVRWMRTEEEDEHPVDGWMDAEICERERENERTIAIWRRKSPVVPVVGYRYGYSIRERERENW